MAQDNGSSTVMVALVAIVVIIAVVFVVLRLVPGTETDDSDINIDVPEFDTTTE